MRLGGCHNMPPPRDLDFWPFDLEAGVGVAFDLGYPCAKFRLPRPFGFWVRADVRDIRQTDGRTTDADYRIMPPRREHNKKPAMETVSVIDCRSNYRRMITLHCSWIVPLASVCLILSACLNRQRHVHTMLSSVDVLRNVLLYKQEQWLQPTVERLVALVQGEHSLAPSQPG